MSDDQIREYLRSRADGLPPPDLVDAISRTVDDKPQQRRFWFAPFVPAAVGLGLTAVVILAAILVSQDPSVGPGPSESPAAPASTPDTSVISRPSPTPVASADTAELAEAAATLTIPAEDAQGSWGSITIERLPDAGGLRTFITADLDEANPDPSTMYFVNDPDMFYLELSIEYRADREPDPLRFGADDWVLVGEADTIAPMDEKFFSLPTDFGPAADELANDTFFGTLTFAVPRSLAGDDLRLAYQPASHDGPVWTGLVRRTGAAPDTFVMAPPEPIAYVERPGMPFGVIDSAEGDALFATPDTCTNPVAGYTVTYPDDWYTNTAIGTWPACSWFSPTTYEVDDPDVIPGEIAIVVRFIPDSGPIGQPSQPVAGGLVEVDGRPTARHEFVGVGGGFIDIGSFVYQFEVGVSGQAPEEGETGDTLIAAASWALEDDPEAYRLATAVLDRIMASLTFDE